MRLFNFGKANHLGWATIVFSDERTVCGYWLSGRILNIYVSLYFPLFWRRADPRRKERT